MGPKGSHNDIELPFRDGLTLLVTLLLVHCALLCTYVRTGTGFNWLGHDKHFHYKSQLFIITHNTYLSEHYSFVFRPESSVQNTHDRPRKYGTLLLRITQVQYEDNSVPILTDLIGRNDLSLCLDNPHEVRLFLCDW